MLSCWGDYSKMINVVHLNRHWFYIVCGCVRVCPCLSMKNTISTFKSLKRHLFPCHKLELYRFCSFIFVHLSFLLHIRCFLFHCVKSILSIFALKVSFYPLHTVKTWMLNQGLLAEYFINHAQSSNPYNHIFSEQRENWDFLSIVNDITL